MRKAKIVCTIGPASSNIKVIRELIKNGMNVARLNFSHGDYESHKRVASIIREQSLKQKTVVSILQDLQGIKIRVGDVEGGGTVLRLGDEVSIYAGTGISSSKELFISYPAMLKDVKEGDSILLDDGLIRLAVTGKDKSSLKARVIEGGLLRSKKGVNLPTTKTTMPAFTDKDKLDLEYGIKELGVDYVAISFVRSAEDIKVIKDWARNKGLSLPLIIAKIEKPEALENIHDILDTVDGIMVARGDLGVEMPTEKVPVIQKMLIELANKKGKIVITATQMLESMTQHSRPTRAEATDVANAVLDGTDALMLSAETALGKYPVESLKMMDTIICFTESSLPERLLSSYQIGTTFPEAIADGACKTAHTTGAKAIVVFTHSGFTAKLISKIRPNMPIIAFTPDENVLRMLQLYWGVSARIVKSKDIVSLDSGFMSEIERALIKEKMAKRGDSIVFVASSPFLGKPNIIRLHRIG